MTTRRSRIIASGTGLPRQVVSNQDLTATIPTSDEWIVQRTGIRQRYIAGDDEKTSDLAAAASRNALSRAGLESGDIDMIVLATTTPDHTFPATAAKVQAMLGIHRGVAFDVQAVCSGFVFALTMADNAIRLGQAERALVIGAETFTRILDWEDRGTCVLFGDGAGAVVLEAHEGEGSVSDTGILSTHLHSDGRHYQALWVDGGPSATKTVGCVRMDGREVFKHAVQNLADLVIEVAQTNGLEPDAIDWIIPHQANRRILEATGRRLGLPAERIVMTVDQHANTSAASVPLALDIAVNDGRIRSGDLVLLEAMGGGFTWGAALVRW